MRPPTAKVGTASKFPHISNYTGRPSTIATNIVSGRTKAGMGVTRPAMLDRTNGQRKTSDETNSGKVLENFHLTKIIYTYIKNFDVGLLELANN